MTNGSKETFHDVFRRTLNNGSSSRPPRLVLNGTLIPCAQTVYGHPCRFKLRVTSGEFYLTMSDSVYAIAKSLEGEEVTVKGFLYLEDDLFEVEKIELAHQFH